jgi:hypothetical protein
VAHGGLDLRADVRELLDARHFDDSLGDLRSLAAALAQCHRWLRDFPRAGESRVHAEKRFEHLASVRDAIPEAIAAGNWRFFCEDTGWAREHAGWLAAMARSYTPRLDLWEGAQCLHAQVHRANVLYSRAEGHPVLLDFEEAVQTFAPPSWDMAYFVQRFCLAQNPDAALLEKRLAAVREAYGSPVPRLAEMMQQTAWFSMAVLLDYQRRGIDNGVLEYQKFVRLEEQARRLEPLLRQHFDV